MPAQKSHYMGNAWFSIDHSIHQNSNSSCVENMVLVDLQGLVLKCKARHVKARHGLSSQGMACQGKARHGMSRQCMPMQGMSFQGKICQCKARFVNQVRKLRL
jgi:hypothetical protein